MAKFAKGQVPWNKGATGLHVGKKNVTSYQPGTAHPRYKPVGTERRDQDGLMIKTASGKWVPKKRYVFEQHNGPIPRGHVVLFGDGDDENYDPANLVLVSRAELMVMNHEHLIKDNAELTRLGKLIADVIIETNKKAREVKR